jgi:K+/H+ antiporter YhaU regulatory subunit KhtT
MKALILSSLMFSILACDLASARPQEKRAVVQQAGDCSVNITGNNNSTASLVCNGVDRKLAEQVQAILNRTRRSESATKEISEKLDQILKQIKPEPTLKEKALEMAREIADFVALRSDEASRLGGSSDASRAYYAQDVEKFEDDVEAEWNRRFASRVTEITDQLKLNGVMPKGLNDSCEKSFHGSAVLIFRRHCAEHIEKAALQLK